MKTKQIGAVIIGVLLASGVSAQEEGRIIPNLEQVKSITLNTSPTQWRGTFYPNGAAKLEWGRDGLFEETDAIAPKGSASFEEIYNMLSPRLKQDGFSSRDMCVYLRVAGDSPTRAWYLEQTEENKEIARTLLNRLYKKVVPRNEENFERLLNEYAFLIGDDPISHIYPKDIQNIAFCAAEADTIDWQAEAENIREFKKAMRAGKGMPDLSPEEEKLAIDEEIARRKAVYEFAKEKLAETTVGQDEGGAQAPSRLWLYVGILSALCVGATLWLIRRKKRSPS